MWLTLSTGIMAQRLIGYRTGFNLDDLSDTTITAPEDFHIIMRSGGVWRNFPIDSTIVSAFSLKTQVKDANFTAESNTIYIVNTSNGPITALMPPAPQVGDRLMFIDAKSNVAGSNNIGWGTNPFTLVANINSYVEGNPSQTYTLDRDCIHFIYNVGDNWAYTTPIVKQANEISAGTARIATTSEVSIGTSDLLIVSPLKLQQALINSKNDILTSVFPLPDASETIKGIIKLASSTLTSDGTDDLTAITPLKLQQKFNSYNPVNFNVQDTITATTGTFTNINTNTLNVLSSLVFPFNVSFTATVDFTQGTVIGLPYATTQLNGVVKLATQLEVNNGLVDTTVVSPLTLQNKLTTDLNALRSDILSNLPNQPTATEVSYGIVRLATINETLNDTNNSEVLTPAKGQYLLENTTTTNRDLIPPGEEALQGLLSISTQALVNEGLDDLTAVSPLKLAVRLLNFKIEILNTIDSTLDNFQILLSGFQAQLDLLNSRILALETKVPIKVLDNFVAIQATVNATVSGNVLSNDVGSNITVTGFAYLGNVYNINTSYTLAFGTFSINTNGDYNYTIINNNYTTNFNNVAPINSIEYIDVQYFVADNLNQIASAYLKIKVAQADNALPTLLDSIPNQTGMEGQDEASILLTNYFSDPEGQSLSYYIAGNTNNSKVNVYIDGNSLKLGYPIWTNNYNTVQNATITVGASDPKGGSTTTSFNVTINPLESLFLENYYRMKNVAASNAGDTIYIYVNADEKATIEGGALSSQFTDDNSNAVVFKAMTQSAIIPTNALNSGTIETIHRYRSNVGYYIYVNNAEKAFVDANNPSFIYEGIAFKAFTVSSGRGKALKRYQYTSLYPSGDYAFTIGTQSQPSNSTYEGIVCYVI